jgi:hypothetical protein
VPSRSAPPSAAAKLAENAPNKSAAVNQKERCVVAATMYVLCDTSSDRKQYCTISRLDHSRRQAQAARWRHLYCSGDGGRRDRILVRPRFRRMPSPRSRERESLGLGGSQPSQNVALLISDFPSSRCSPTRCESCDDILSKSVATQTAAWSRDRQPARVLMMNANAQDCLSGHYYRMSGRCADASGHKIYGTPKTVKRTTCKKLQGN